MISKKISLILIFLITGLISTKAPANVIKTSAGKGADATLKNDEKAGPETNWGNKDYIEIRKHSIRTRIGYLKFDISESPDQAENAIIGLQTHPQRTENIAEDTMHFAIYGMTDDQLDNWKENEVSYGNAPGFESAPNGEYAINDKLVKLTNIEVYKDSGNVFLYTEDSPEMDDFINNSSNNILTFAIIQTNENSGNLFLFNSKEAGINSAPRLILQTENGNPPNTPPTITLHNPSQGIKYAQDRTLKAMASTNDIDGVVSSVEFYFDGSQIDSLVERPWELDIDFSSYGLGTHSMHALATDDDSSKAISDTIEFEIIDKEDPVKKDFEPRVMEKLDRGIVAIKREQDVMISWRMLGKDPRDIAFNLYRNGTKINKEIIEERTNYTDKNGDLSSEYYIRPVINDKELQKSKTVGVWENNYKDITLDQPDQGPYGGIYEPQDMSVGDLDGDGEYEFVVQWYPSNAKDNSFDGMTDVSYLEGFEMDGTSLWRINLGKNMRSGQHYIQFIVYDFDNDGKAELVCKTAPGTKDGIGQYLNTGPAASDDDQADYRRSDGKIEFTSPEYLTIFDGETGQELQTKMYIPQYDFIDNPASFWGDDYGNRSERYLAAAAHFDRQNPSIVMCRGYYAGTVIATWDWDGENLTNRWKFVADPSSQFAGQGSHSLSVGDVDYDGKDEIMYGSAVIDHDGTGLYSTGYGHGDAQHLGDLDPDRPGLEYYMSHEDAPNQGIVFRDAGTGEILWEYECSYDPQHAVAGDISAQYRGAECWGVAKGRGGDFWDAGSKIKVYNCKGKPINIIPDTKTFLLYWDGDLTREMFYDSHIDDIAKGRLLTAEGFTNDGMPNLSADLFGDWREEIILRHENNQTIRIYTTPDTSAYRRYTLMHDPIYRLSIAWQNVAYNQPPHVSYYMPEESPQPNIIYPEEVVSVSHHNIKHKNVVEEFNLMNTPNPFNTSTVISFVLDKKKRIELSIYDIQGKKLKTLIEGEKRAGKHEVNFIADDLASGVYIYKLKTRKQLRTKKMLLLK